MGKRRHMKRRSRRVKATQKHGQESTVSQGARSTDKPVRRSVTLRAWHLLVAISVVVTVITGGYAMRPQVAIQPSPVSEIGSAAADWFRITNAGMWSLRDVELQCVTKSSVRPLDMPDEVPGVYVFYLDTKAPLTPLLKHDEVIPIPCTRQSLTPPVKTVRVAAELRYSYRFAAWPFLLHKRIRYAVAQTNDGLAWVRCPSSLCEEEDFDVPEGVKPRWQGEGTDQTQTHTVDFSTLPRVE